MVLEALLTLEQTEAAQAFAGAAVGPQAAGLSAYVAIQHDPEQAKAQRAVLVRAQGFEKARREADALKTLGEPVETPVTVYEMLSEFLRGTLLSRTPKIRAAAAAFERAATGARAIGWHTHASEALYQAGLMHFRRSNYRAALGFFQTRLTVEQALDSEVGQGRAHYGIALCLRTLGKLDEAEAHLAQAQVLAKATRDGLYLAKAHSVRGRAAAHAEDTQAAREAFDAMGAAVRSVDPSAVPPRFRPAREAVAGTLITALTNSASLAFKMKDDAAAMAHAQEALRQARRTRNQRMIDDAAAVLARIEGARHDAAGRPLQALSQYTRAEKLYRRIGARSDQADVLSRLARVRNNLGDYPRALAHARQAVAIQEQTGAKRKMATAYNVAALALQQMCRLDEAEAQARLGLGLANELRDPGLQITALIRVASIFQWRGEYDRSLDFLNQALALHRSHPKSTDAAQVYSALAQQCKTLGRYERALKLLDEAEKAREERGHAYDGTGLRLTRASLLGLTGEFQEAAEILTELLAHYEANGNRRAQAGIHREKGQLLVREGKFAEGAEAHERAMGLYVSIGHPGSEIGARIQRSLALMWAKRLEEALDEATFAHEQAEEYGEIALRTGTCAQLAAIHYRLGEYRQAVLLAREGCELAGSYALDRAEEERTILRDGAYSSLAQWGMRAARRLGNGDLVYDFMERERATSLVASLGGREALRGAKVPDALRRREEGAKADAAMAFHQFEAARRAKAPLPTLREKRRTLEEARERHWDAVAAIQRAVRQQADLAYPSIAQVSDVMKALADDTALVLYGNTGYDVVVVVLTRAKAVFHVLGKDDQITPVLSAVCDDPADPRKVAAARAALIEPLQLGPEIESLLVAPYGQMAHVPFAVIERERSVSLVPSATAWMMLRDMRAVAPGSRVLAIGDPSYDSRPPPSSRQKGVLRGRRLTPLPQTRIEVEAVGDEKLLGLEATETAFRKAVHKEKHWRAVHIACHGLVDDDRPARSALVLTHDAENDGYLHANEIFGQLSFSADLVVLSACETWRGRVFRGEGLVGMSRAFMLAGTPRVIASLWKVDDEATRALMQKFYELWGGANGKQGLVPAAALKAAQAHVRAQKGWEDPKYWAAWVLWGLAD